jgi:2-dehydropantoate 2-reductase
MRRIHILGAGAIGLLHAHYLNVANVPCTLLSRSALYSREERQTIRIFNQLNQLTTSDASFEHTNCLSPISTLIVCTKANDTIGAINSIFSRLDESCSVLLLQNGVLAVKDQVERSFPQLQISLLGSTTHGVTRNEDPYAIHHVGKGTTAIGSLNEQPLDIKSRQLMDTLTNAWKPLGATQLEGELMHKLLLTKMAVNACLNPLAALLRCKNGGLLEGEPSLLHDLCTEVVIVFPELGMSTEELVAVVRDVCEKTAGNTNSMLQDVQSGRMSEISYITGYMLKEAKQRQQEMPMHKTLYLMVKQLELLRYRH